LIDFKPVEQYWWAEYETLLSYLRSSHLYLPRSRVIPYRHAATPFLLETSAAGLYVDITMRVKDHWNGVVSNTVTVITTSTSMLVYLNLGLGSNEVTIDIGSTDETFFNRWFTATYATLYGALAKQLHDHVTSGIAAQEQRMLSHFSSVLVEHLLPWQDMLVDVHSWRALSVRLGLRSITNQSGRDRGVKTWLASLTSQTPIISPMSNPDSELDYYLQRVYRAESFGGSEAHIWLPNPCITEWLTFGKYIDAIHDHSLQNFTERTINDTVGNLVERNDFPFPVSNRCSLSQLLEDLTCMDSISVSVTSDIITRMCICFPGYPLDFVVDPCRLLGLRRLDCGGTLDEGEHFDTNDDFDPLGDGWEGHSLSGRLDGLPHHCYDTMIRYPDVPEKEECCYGIYGSACTFLGAQLLEEDTPPEFLVWWYLGQFVGISPPLPTVASFTAIPASGPTLGACTLTWTTTNATYVNIDNGVGTGLVANGSIVVNPAITTTYTITAVGPAATATDTATYTVIAPPLVPVFTAVPNPVSAGTPMLLTWSTIGAVTVSIDNGIGAVATSGILPLTAPAVDTTYTLTATNGGGVTLKLLTVTVCYGVYYLWAFGGSTATDPTCLTDEETWFYGEEEDD